MRAAFSDALVSAARKDPRVLLLTGDHGYALFDAFRKVCPDQYINCGIAEQNMVGMAAGLAKAGFRPIVYGLAAFIPIRVLEQIKMDVCYEGLPVCFIGDGAGVVYAQLGTSHQSTEDIAVLRAVPEISIYSPCDRFELTACFEHMLQAETPAYLRMGKADLGDVHGAAIATPDIAGPVVVRRQGATTLAIATGSGVRLAQDVAPLVGGMDLVSQPLLKPFPGERLRELARPYRSIVVFEEHSIHGGLGGAVAELLVGEFSGRFVRVGVNDRFTRMCGSYGYVMQEHGLDTATVAAMLNRQLAQG